MFALIELRYARHAHCIHTHTRPICSVLTHWFLWLLFLSDSFISVVYCDVSTIARTHHNGYFLIIQMAPIAPCRPLDMDTLRISIDLCETYITYVIYAFAGNYVQRNKIYSTHLSVSIFQFCNFACVDKQRWSIHEIARCLPQMIFNHNEMLARKSFISLWCEKSLSNLRIIYCPSL